MDPRAPVLVTRAEPGATRTCQTLEARGYRAVNAATARIETVDAAPDWSGAGALIVTSPNGAARLEALAPPRDLPVFAVGAATAAAARAAGHARIITGAGDAAGLVDVILSTPVKGRLIHLRGRDQAFDLTGALSSLGREADGYVVYEARPATALSPQARAALGPKAAVLIHSPLGAKRLVNLAEAAGLLSALGAARIVAISAAAAEPLRSAAAGRVTLAGRPDEAALLDALETVCPPGA